MWEDLLYQGLDGQSGHVKYESALEDLNYTLAGKQTDDYPHTIFQFLNHMIFWQDFLIEELAGGSPKLQNMQKARGQVNRCLFHKMNGIRRSDAFWQD